MKIQNLKRTLFICLLTLLFVNCFSNSEKPKNRSYRDSSVCLVVTGNVFAAGNSENNKVKVELIYYNTLVDSLVFNQNKKFEFILKKDAYYTIRITKEGYLPRIISVCTSLKNIKEDDLLYKFHFDTELIENKELSRLNSEALGFPIAIVNFDNELGGFYYSEEYTSNIKREIYFKTVTIK